MVSTQLNLILLVTTTLVSSTFALPNHNGCAIIDYFGTCRDCYKRKLLTNGEGCGPLLPESDKCLLYGLQESRTIKSVCNNCKPGYANKLTFNGTQFVQECVNATLKNCILENEIDFGQRVERLCTACPDKQYSVFNETALTSTCQNITNPVQNCLWGSLVNPVSGNATCLRCEDGYAVDGVSGQCDKTVEEGCWIQRSKKCTACNPFEGYSINVN